MIKQLGAGRPLRVIEQAEKWETDIRKYLRSFVAKFL